MHLEITIMLTCKNVFIGQPMFVYYVSDQQFCNCSKATGCLTHILHGLTPRFLRPKTFLHTTADCVFQTVPAVFFKGKLAIGNW